MKTILLSIILLSATTTFSQMGYFEIVCDNMEARAVDLIVDPYHENDMLEIKSIPSNANPNYSNIYTMHRVANNSISELKVPQVSEITSKPVFVKRYGNGDYTLMGGNTENYGNELIRYNGEQATIYDLVHGPESSYPTVLEFPITNYPEYSSNVIIATVDGTRQLFLMDQNGGCNQMTFGDEEFVRIVSAYAVCGDIYEPYIYYQSRVFDESVQKFVNKLRRLELWGEYGHAIYEETASEFYDVEWSHATFSREYIFEKKTSIANPLEVVLSIKEIQATSNAVWGLDYSNSVVLEELSSIGSERIGFVFNNRKYTYVVGSEQFYSTDGIYELTDFDLESFTTVARIKTHFISENNNLFFIRERLDGTEELIQFHEKEADEVLYVGHDLSFITRDSKVVYLSDKSEDGSSKIVMHNELFNQTVDLNLENGSTIAELASAILFDDQLTFLSDELDGTRDILQLKTSPFFTSLTDEMDLLCYPNPMESGTDLIVELDEMEAYSLYSTSGAEMESGMVYKGTNRLNFNSLRTGVYLLQIGDSTTKLVVK